MPGYLKLAYFTLSLMLTGVCLALVSQNHGLKKELKILDARARRGYEVEAGLAVPTLTGRDAYGNPLAFPYNEDQRSTLIMVFSPHCGVCDENWPIWEALLDRLPQDKVRAVAVDLSSQADWAYLMQHGIADLPVIAQPDPSSIIGYRMRLVPQTFLVGSDGTVQKVWTGLLGSTEVAELEQRIATLSAAESAP